MQLATIEAIKTTYLTMCVDLRAAVHDGQTEVASLLKQGLLTLETVYPEPIAALHVEHGIVKQE